MRKEVVLELADALESDKYKDRQCVNLLSVGEGDERKWDVYGVMCELHVAKGVIDPPLMDGTSKRWEYAGLYHDLPLAVAAHAEYDPRTDLFVVNRISPGRRGLVGLNDSGATFPELAEALRAYAAA